MTVAKMKLTQLRVDGGTQFRRIPPESVEDYRDAMLDGDEFPPVEAIYDGTDFWLWDGFTRVAAAKEGGIKSIAVNVERGTHRDAVVKGLGANMKNGNRRTLEDKRNAVTAALQMEEFAQTSERAIARICGVSRDLVLAIKRGSTRTAAAPKKPPKSSGKTQGSTYEERGPEWQETPPADGPADQPGEPADDAASGPVTITKPGVKPVGNLHEVIAERDMLRDRLDSALAMLQEATDRITAFELRFETGDPHRELMTALNEEKERSRQIDERLRGMQNEKNEAIRAAKYWKKQATGK